MSQQILYCHCAYARIIPKRVKKEVLQKLCEQGISFDTVADLCKLSADKDPYLKEIAQGKLKIAACYPRAVKWLFASADASLSENVEIVNMRKAESEEIVKQLLADSFVV